jgi:hypothetical protein
MIVKVGLLWGVQWVGEEGKKSDAEMNTIKGALCMYKNSIGKPTKNCWRGEARKRDIKG